MYRRQSNTPSHGTTEEVTTHTHLTALFPGLPGWAGTRKVKPMKGKTSLDFTEAKDSEWQ